MVRMNVMMPDLLAKHLMNVPNKSRYIAEALEEKIARERSRQLRAELAVAYAESAAADRQEAKEWDAVSVEGWPA